MENLIYLSQHLDLSIPVLLELYLEDDLNLVFLVNDKIAADSNLSTKERILIINQALLMFEELLEVVKEKKIEYIQVGNPYNLGARVIWEFNEESARKFDFYKQHLGFSEKGILFIDNR